jgi:putative nucleotidyltransferase with HDIG domain
MKSTLPAALERVNKELWVVLSLFAIALLLNNLIAAQKMVLSFYVLPTVASAYFYGRRHGTLTAFASVLLVVGLLLFRNSTATAAGIQVGVSFSQWLEVAVWGGSLIITGYLMGTLYEHKNLQINELRETYQGVLMILRHFISKDTYTENHCYRVSVYATRIAALMNLPTDRIEDVRAAALLHDIGKLDISRDLLYKAAKLTRDEYETVQQHVPRGIEMLEPVGGARRRVIPIILAHHDKFDGSGYNPTSGDAIPLESRIIAVADVYDALTSDRPYRKAMSPFEARDVITNGAETEFDPKVIAAFNTLFKRGELEIWSAPLSAAGATTRRREGSSGSSGW